ncbi:MAG: MFS transporter [Acidimicrobiia bacterium]|jgi:fucose permease
MSVNRSPRPALGLLLIALAAFVMLGLVDGALGVAWPSLRSAFNRSVSDLGLLLAFGSVGYLTSSLSYGWLHVRSGTGLLLGFGAGLMTLGLAGFAFSPEWILIAISAICTGLGGGLVDTGMNAHAALAFDIRSINLLHASFGVGATLGPLVMTVSLTTSGAWRAGYATLGLLQIMTAALIWTRRERWVAGEDETVGSPTAPMHLRRWLLLASFFLYTGAEVAAGQWSFTLLTESRGMSTAAAGAWVAIYWAGLTAGRFLFGVFGDRVSLSGTLGGSALVSLVGIGLLWIDPGGFGQVGLPIAGLGFAAVFPTLVAITPARIGRDRSTSSMGFQLAAANLGAASIPWALGLIAAAYGLETLAPGLFIATLLLAGMHVLSDREARRR